MVWSARIAPCVALVIRFTIRAEDYALGQLLACVAARMKGSLSVLLICQRLRRHAGVLLDAAEEMRQDRVSTVADWHNFMVHTRDANM